MTLLDDFQAKLTEIGASTTKVLASYSDERLNFPGPNDIRIFLPDLHLLSSNGRNSMHAAGPHPSHSLLKRVIQATTEFRTSVKQGDPSTICAAYFLGDTLDLWREAPPGTPVPTAAKGIVDDHADLLALACSAELKARFVLGNHDFELFQAASFVAADRRYYFPATNPSMIALHGDVFDWIEDFPDKWNETVVYYFSPFSNIFDQIRGKIACMLREDAPPPAAPDDILSVCGSQQEAVEHHELWKRAWQAVTETNASHSLGLRCVVIGHTHTARLVVLDSGDGFMALVDVGAWVQDVHNNTGEKEQGTIGAICGNEIRIFQLSTL
jgi:UDP-2,3-diacylglucosamine pyrophosphatase LpxH